MPSSWATERARRLTPVQCGFKGGSDLGWHGTCDAIAEALDDARTSALREASTLVRERQHIHDERWCPDCDLADSILALIEKEKPHA